MPISDSATIRVVDPTALSAGSDFGTRYRIEALLGQGGMGRVYKAYDKTLDRMIALKVVRQGVMADVEALNRFKQELLLASKISHTNILRIHDMGEVGDVKFITMAYVEGPDLHHILQATPKLPFERVVNFATQLAAALAAAQAENVIHRDLKPQNILVAKDDHLYVSDFGLARSFEESAVQMTRTGAFMGTPRYMSPEQVEGKPADLRSDLYAYGLILYEMATGDVPFTGESTLKVMYQRIQEKPKSPKTLNPDLPNWFVQVIMRCLERDPTVRYQHADEIVLDLQGARSTVSTTRGMGGATRTVQIQIPHFGDKRWIGAAAGAAVLVLVGILFAVPYTRHMIPGFGGPKTGPVSGVPPIESGRFIAVLPLQVLGDESQLGYLAQGIQEALSTKLFQLKDIRVTGTDAASKVNQKQPLVKIGEALGANMIVQGTMQGSGDKIRIILKLEDVANNKEIWSQQFDGVTGDLFTLEDEIYNPLVSALNINPTNDERANAGVHATENIAAYDLYLKGRNAMRGQQDLKNVDAAMNFYQDALKNDPGFALAYAGLSEASLVNYREKKDAFWAQKALAAAEQAERLNDNSAEVHFVLGRVYLGTGKTAEAIAELKRALAIEPNSDDGYRGLGGAFLALGEKEQALQAYEKAVQINSYYWYNYNQLGKAYSAVGDYDKALAAYKRVTELEPDNSFGYLNLGVAYCQQGKYDQAIPYFQKSLQLQPSYLAYSNLGTAYFYLKRYPDSVPMFEKAVELNPNDQLFMGNLADAYRWSGQRDKANATYDKAIALAYKELEVNPKSTDALEGLALYYGKKGDASQSIEFIRRARSINAADVDLMYVEAIVFALANRPDDALKSLRATFGKGYSVQEAQNDPELATLQGRPEFVKLVAEFGKTK
jgi:tetratricopeptide (TPR) repeat protein/TolB-like protein